MNPAGIARKVVAGSPRAFIHLSKFSRLLQTLWLFTGDDLATFVLLNIVFGISTTLAIRLMEVRIQHLRIYAVLRRLSLVLFFIWSNILIFNLAN